ncbi:MAG: hypothetical protein K1V97_02880 [Lachnospiraceae bacterium]
MTLAKAKIDAQKILLESRKTAVFVSLCTVFFKIFLTAALFVSIYSLTILPDFARIWENIYLKILLCLLFSLAAVFSLLFYALTDFSEKRWFYQNTYTAQPLSAFFKAPRIRHIFKITFLFWLRRLLSVGCFLFYLAPFLAGCGGLYYALRTADLPITALYMALGALFCILPLCAYFGFAAVQRFAFCDGLLAENPDCSIVEILGTSKALAKAYGFANVNLKLRFLLWKTACLLILPLFYVLPYYRQTVGCAVKIAMNRKHLSAETQKPIVFKVRGVEPDMV